jgi:hypothetical protein
VHNHAPWLTGRAGPMTDWTRRLDEGAHRSAKIGRASTSTGRDSASVRSRSRKVPEHDIRDLTCPIALDLTPSASGQCTRPSAPQCMPLELTGRVQSPEDHVWSVKNSRFTSRKALNPASQAWREEERIPNPSPPLKLHLICKYANTNKCSPPCARVLAFLQSFSQRS